MHLSPAWLLCCVQILWFCWLTCVCMRCCGWEVWLVEWRVLYFGTHFSCAVEANILLLTAIWSSTLEWYCVQIWYIFMHRALYGDLLKFYKFLFWLSVFWYCALKLIATSIYNVCHSGSTRFSIDIHKWCTKLFTQQCSIFQLIDISMEWHWSLKPLKCHASACSSAAVANSHASY